MRNGNPKGRGYSDVVWRPKESSGIGALPARRALLSCLCGFKCFLYIVARPPNGLPGPPTSINHDAARRGGGTSLLPSTRRSAGRALPARRCPSPSTCGHSPPHTHGRGQRGGMLPIASLNSSSAPSPSPPIRVLLKVLVPPINQKNGGKKWCMK